MARLIPNENTWVGFVASITNIAAPTPAEITAAVELTPWLISLNATTQGNALPTPTLDSLFETSISGTVTGQFTADFYRDDTTDTAWETLPRGTDGNMVIARYGNDGAAPETADVVEVWPIRVTSRSVQNMGSNQVLVFQVTAAIPTEPNEAAVIAAPPAGP